MLVRAKQQKAVLNIMLKSSDKAKNQSLLGLFRSLSLLLFIDESLDVIGERPEADEGSVSLIFLLYNIGVLEVVLELGSALDARIAHLTNLIGVELLPGTVVELAVEVLDELGVDEIQKSVTHVAVILD